MLEKMRGTNYLKRSLVRMNAAISFVILRHVIFSWAITMVILCFATTTSFWNASETVLKH